MLALTLDVNQKIIIGEGANQIVVQLVSIKHGKARLAFEAARHIAIDRESVRKAKLSNPDGPRGADAACHVTPKGAVLPRGLAGADYEHKRQLPQDVTPQDAR